ncbi:hypothetical protein ACGFIW_22900 [Micromonospora sp. NPDC048935]|uniref:hypothetical protein n=1 Tax=Micromonospora sp. NPDC048935 TaxID=3364262 RepID=UPI003719C419
MTDLSAGTAQGSAVETPTEASTGPIRTLVGLQVYAVAAYLAAAVVPYLWSPRPYPPTWTFILPGWLLGVPGLYLTLLGPVPGILLAVIGVGVLVATRRRCSASRYRWCVASTALAAAYGVFACTPFASIIAAFVAD